MVEQSEPQVKKARKELAKQDIKIEVQKQQKKMINLLPRPI